MEPLRFWMRSLIRSWRYVVALKDNVDVALYLVLALLAVGSLSFALDRLDWLPPAIAALVLAFMVFIGPYLEWKDAVASLAARQRLDAPQPIVEIENSGQLMRLIVENVGAPAEFEAQIQVLEGQETWFPRGLSPTMSNPYRPIWNGTNSCVSNLKMGFKDRIHIGIRQYLSSSGQIVAELAPDKFYYNILLGYYDISFTAQTRKRSLPFDSDLSHCLSRRWNVGEVPFENLRIRLTLSSNPPMNRNFVHDYYISGTDLLCDTY
jgi:hypothetical protein